MNFKLSIEKNMDSTKTTKKDSKSIQQMPNSSVRNVSIQPIFKGDLMHISLMNIWKPLARLVEYLLRILTNTTITYLLMWLQSIVMSVTGSI